MGVTVPGTKEGTRQVMKWKALLELADEVVKVPVGEQARADVRPIDEAKNLRRELRQKQQRHT